MTLQVESRLFRHDVSRWESSLSLLFRRTFEEQVRWDDACRADPDNGYPVPSASLLFCGDHHIRTLNRRYRGQDAVTDILSFPLLDMDEGQFLLPLGRADLDQRGDHCLLPLGDLVLSLPRAMVQARRHGHSLDREVHFLALHGMLHLLGFDHDTEEREARMRAIQERLLADMGLERLP